MSTAEVEFLYACEALQQALNAARPDIYEVIRLRERVRATQRAFWATLDGDS